VDLQEGLNVQSGSPSKFVPPELLNKGFYDLFRIVYNIANGGENSDYVVFSRFASFAK
jgi:hypothetical protein